MHESQAAAVIAQLLAGLNDLHACGFAHEDVKLENILFTRLPALHDSEPCVFLADMGLVLPFAMCSLPEFMGRGTQDCQSPEVLNRWVTGGSAADVYAVGVVLYRLLTAGAFPT